VYTAAYGLQLWQLVQPKKILPASAPASPTEKNHYVHSSLQPTAYSCGSLRNHEILPASAQASPTESIQLYKGSLQPPTVAACAAKENSSSPCKKLVLKKIIFTKKLTASSCGSLHNQ
jgi:hypothetical protein